MPTINFETKLFKVGPRTILRLPPEVSAKLPSRGQTMVEGTINGVALKTPLEPDGKWSHWFEIDDKLSKLIHAKAGDTVKLKLQPTNEWQEPPVPADLGKALADSPKAHELWQQITPMARWEWVRSTRSTNNPATRERRVRVAISKLEAGKRRPCCWNRNACSEPSVSKNGILQFAESVQ